MCTYLGGSERSPTHAPRALPARSTSSQRPQNTTKNAALGAWEATQQGDSNLQCCPCARVARSCRYVGMAGDSEA
jgi:hypothetical protein